MYGFFWNETSILVFAELAIFHSIYVKTNLCHKHNKYFVPRVFGIFSKQCIQGVFQKFSYRQQQMSNIK